MMSAYGGSVAAGSAVAVLQSIGAAGMGTVATGVVATGGGVVGAAAGAAAGYLGAKMNQRKRSKELVEQEERPEGEEEKDVVIGSDGQQVDQETQKVDKDTQTSDDEKAIPESSKEDAAETKNVMKGKNDDANRISTRSEKQSELLDDEKRLEMKETTDITVASSAVKNEGYQRPQLTKIQVTSSAEEPRGTTSACSGTDDDKPCKSSGFGQCQGGIKSDVTERARTEVAPTHHLKLSKDECNLKTSAVHRRNEDDDDVDAGCSGHAVAKVQH
jgi:hypothetical protein